ncbi:uncharacterized protein LOC108038957 isoform X2 [Drosophila rhopaloa]|uniref:Peptidase S1 domain-containing protein n=1 Tax=Drosophila rhopaloa TaxID=1041015 RepID=A0ABM5GXQ6_DRORH|nr:uncharacterized protein LOC108038957 isoform X2 [Drosophila rhopaloa]
MLLVNNNVSRNLCSFLLFFMLLLPLSSESGTHYILRREKRLSSPLFDEKKTLTLAKYVVSIRSRSPRHFFGDNHFCGGVIVSQTYILTSAHCAME